MDRSSAGISGQYARSGNGYNQPGNHAASSSRGQSRHANVRQWDNPPRTAPGRNEFYHSSGTCSSQSLQSRTVNPAQDFNALIKQEIMDDLVRKSDRFGHRYNGKNHSQFASSIKKYTSAATRPLNRAEQSQLIRMLQNFTPTRSWNWRSLTTTLHSFTSAGVFTSHKPMDERVKLTQAHLLSTLLDAIIFNCSQKPQARNIDARGIANLLWAIAKLVDNGRKHTPEFQEALAALLPHVDALKDQFIPQHIANLLWAMAKLVDNGQELITGPKKAVAALLPYVKTQKEQFNAQGIANLLWAMAKLIDNGQELTTGPEKAVAELLPYVKTQKGQFNAQGIVNLLWAMAKLVDNGQERTPELKEAVAALLPYVKTQKEQFNAQAITNLLWAMAKLADNGQEQTPDFNSAVTALLPHVIAQKANFKPQEIANLIWSMAKLVDNGHKWTSEFNKAVNALAPHVSAQKDQFIPQHIANLLWAMAKLVDNGQERTPEFNEAMAALLPRINTEKANFNPQEITNVLWAMAKLADNGLEQTPALEEAVAALLPHVNTQKEQFIPQHIANLLWAMAKLMDKGQKWVPGLKKAVAGLLPRVISQKAKFEPQGTANLLWAMAKLVDKGQKQTPKLNEAVAALLSHVNAQKTHFKTQEISNLLWATAKLVDNGHKPTTEFIEVIAELLPCVNAQEDQLIPQHIANLLCGMAKLGELVELNVVTSMFEPLVYRLSENPQLSQQDISMSLWGVMVCCARLPLDSKNNNWLEKHMDDLFTRVENISSDNEEDQRIIAMAASWLGRACPVVPHYPTTRSKRQSEVRHLLQSCFPSLQIEEEKSLNSLPPVDLLLPDHNMVIEVQGPSHYVGGDFKTRNGSTLLKIALLQKAGFEVIEIPVNRLGNQDLMKPYIDQIKIRTGIQPQGHGSASLKRRLADEACVTADDRQP
ncbi:RAP domain-containing protein [Endozoicomonas acroporae]|uniref:RAP domain-containing protein n=1 Tax=Endozoicomonas acroporae TaxID=1701104 RepID=UPI0013D79E17|nr:RAP domain-containing protein [Endozoicomonas acroporae]